MHALLWMLSTIQRMCTISDILQAKQFYRSRRKGMQILSPPWLTSLLIGRQNEVSWQHLFHVRVTMVKCRLLVAHFPWVTRLCTNCLVLKCITMEWYSRTLTESLQRNALTSVRFGSSHDVNLLLGGWSNMDLDNWGFITFSSLGVCVQRVWVMCVLGKINCCQFICLMQSVHKF